MPAMPPQKISSGSGQGVNVKPHLPSVQTGSGQEKLTPAGHSRQAMNGTGQSPSSRHIGAAISSLLFSPSVAPGSSDSDSAHAASARPAMETTAANVHFNMLPSPVNWRTTSATQGA